MESKQEVVIIIDNAAQSAAAGAVGRVSVIGNSDDDVKKVFSKILKSKEEDDGPRRMMKDLENRCKDLSVDIKAVEKVYDETIQGTIVRAGFFTTAAVGLYTVYLHDNATCDATFQIATGVAALTQVALLSHTVISLSQMRRVGRDLVDICARHDLWVRDRLIFTGGDTEIARDSPASDLLKAEMEKKEAFGKAKILGLRCRPPKVSFACGMYFVGIVGTFAVCMGIVLPIAIAITSCA